MKIIVEGKAHLKGVSKRTGNAYDFNQVHYLSPAFGVEGLAARTVNLDPGRYPIETIEVGKAYNIDFDNRGFVVGFEPIK